MAMLSRSYLRFSLKRVLDNKGEKLLTDDEVESILSDFSNVMLLEYAKWFEKKIDMVTWLALLFKKNPKHISFPSIENIKSYRAELCYSLRQLPSKEIVEIMEFFTPEEANFFATSRRRKSR